MKKSELSKLKAMQKKCDKYANEANKMADAVYAFASKNTDMQLLNNANAELLKAMVSLCNANNLLIDAIRTEQPNYLETMYNL
mgnify:CR=1 FL=1